MSLSEQPIRVLFVDDDANIRTVARLALEALTSWNLEFAESGYEALLKAEKNIPNLILLDVMMPGLDGQETLVKLKEKKSLRTVPVIFVTAKVQVEEVAQYMRSGAQGVIRKPFDPMSLPEDIAAILRCKPSCESLSPCL